MIKLKLGICLSHIMKNFISCLCTHIEMANLIKIPYILNDYYSLEKPIGPRNYSPLILMVSTNGENLDQNTALITTIE